ncbi:hypothetical protein ACFL9U_01455 [Thermodesulfobacteriota bacterium]
MIDYKKLRLLSQVPSTTLFEAPLLTYLKHYFRFKNYDQILGNGYIVFKPKNETNGILLTIHIDRLGLVCCSDNKIRYSNYFGYESYGKQYSPAFDFGKRFLDQSVQAYDPVSGKILGRGKVTGVNIEDSSDLIFTVDDLKLGNHSLPLPISYQREVEMRNNHIIGQIDNVISIYLAYELLERELGYTFLFSTQEEIGMSWRQMHDFLSRNYVNEIIVLDTAPVEGLASINEVDLVFRLSDDMADYTEEFVNKLVALAKQHNLRHYLITKHPPNDNAKGITELGRLITHGNLRIKGATIQFPTMNYHTIQETTTVDSFESILFFLTCLSNSQNFSV